MPLRVTDRTDLRVDHLDPGLARRVRQTVSCDDCALLPKVAHAGEVIDHDGVRVQVMHNGVLVEEGGYYGDWMAEIIRVLAGHHEPQEELVFSTMVARVAEASEAEGSSPAMLEFGAFWAYYSLWFCHDIPNSRAVGIEPDPAYLAVGRRNAELNALSDRVTLEPGVVGGSPGSTVAFVAESDGVERPVAQFDLESLMAAHDLPRVELVLIDIQGWELLLLERAMPLLLEGRVRFVLVSTHHHSISGDALTHQRVRDLLVGAGATVLAEHSVGESASGDGLIAVSFDDRDADLRVDVTHARAVDSLFGELEYDLDTSRASTRSEHEKVLYLERELGAALEQLEASRARIRRMRRRIRALKAQHDPTLPAPALAVRVVRRLTRRGKEPRR